MKGPGKLLITFDDGLACHRAASEELSNRGLLGTFGLVTSRIGQVGFLDDMIDIPAMMDSGHFFCNHSADHLWNGLGEEKQGRRIGTRQEITADLRKAAKAMENLPRHKNIRGDYIIIPYGTLNVFGPDHLRELLGYFRWIRMTVGGPSYGDPAGWIAEGGKRIYPGDYRGRLIGITAAADTRYPDEVCRTLADTADVGGLVVICYHSICHVVGNAQDVTWERFISDMDFAGKLVKEGKITSVLPTDIR